MTTLTALRTLDLFHPTAKGPVEIGGTKDVLTGTVVAEGVALTVGYAENTKVHRKALAEVTRSPYLADFAAGLDGFAGAAFVETRCPWRPVWAEKLKCDAASEIVFRVEVGGAGDLVVSVSRFVHGRMVTSRYRLARAFALADAHDPAAVVSALVPPVPMERNGKPKPS